MAKFCPQRILREARHSTTSANFSIAEMIFVHRNRNLTDEEKIIWLMLAALSADHAFLRCSITFEHLASLVNKPADVVHLILKRLQHLGFLFIEETAGNFVALKVSFPPEGLLALKKAPKIVDEEMMHVRGVYKRPERLRQLIAH